MDNLILSTAYFPPVSYFQLLANHRKVYIEAWENYTKQTYRNRCIIYAANGKLALSVPVIRGSFHKVMVKDLKIDNSKQWQRTHLRAIKAAYSSSAFYEFYIDEIRAKLESRFDYLVDLNLELTGLVSLMIGIDPVLTLTKSFTAVYSTGADNRYNITPKSSPADPGKSFEPYFQVFGIEHGFIPNLSILDLLFNMGPESLTYIR
jgi:hypothetical protein